MTEIKNVFMKLQEARVLLQNKTLQKSGRNTFSNYDYFQLGDFLTEINAIFHELKLFSHITFTHEVATLTILNAEKSEEQIVFTSPMADCSLKGAHPIQNLGSVQTYQRRYLYMLALEIVENDVVDATEPKETKPKPSNQPNQTHSQSSSSNTAEKASDKQIKMIHDLFETVSQKKNTTKEELAKKIKINMEDIEKMSKNNASKIITFLQKYNN